MKRPIFRLMYASYDRHRRLSVLLVALIAVVVVGSLHVAFADGSTVGDLNADGTVNITDLSIFLTHWQQTGSGIAADFNDDNVVNITDLSMLLADWGNSSETASGCTSDGTVAPCIGGATTGASGWGTPSFDDEFTGNTLSSKWSTGWFDDTTASGPVNGAENDCYTPGQVSVGNNGLDLSFTQQNETCANSGGNTEPYDAGLITTDPEGGTTPGYTFTYGYAEARIYLPPSGNEIANWPAFWAVTPPSEAYGELDIMEGLGGQACYHFHSDSGAPGGCASGNYSGWHTFGANWQNGIVTYYYDGEEVGTITSDVTSDPMYLILNNSDGSDGGPTVAPTNMLVRYVRVWQH